MEPPARTLRRNLTHAERVLWGSCDSAAGLALSAAIPDPPYVVDFACIEARLIIEADGGQHPTRRT